MPLSDLAELEEIVGPRQITREDNQRFVTIQCNVLGRDIGSFVEEAGRAIERGVDLPAGYFVTWGGQFRLQQEANRRLAVVVPITLIVIFLFEGEGLRFSSGSPYVTSSSLSVLCEMLLHFSGGRRPGRRCGMHGVNFCQMWWHM